MSLLPSDDFSTPHKYCDNEDSSENEDWCLDIDEYIQLPSFGQSPSHPVMFNPGNMAEDMRDSIQEAMLSWG